jgi:hypothetical protein
MVSLLGSRFEREAGVARSRSHSTATPRGLGRGASLSFLGPPTRLILNDLYLVGRVVFESGVALVLGRNDTPATHPTSILLIPKGRLTSVEVR